MARPMLTYLALSVLIASCNKEEKWNKNLPDEVQFTHLPTELDQMLEFGAIGQIQVIPKVHGGFLLKNPYAAIPGIPVYAMSEGVIYNIRKEQKAVNEPGAPLDLQGKIYDDYALDIALTKHSRMYYGHVTQLSATVLQEAGVINGGRGVENRVSIPVSAGQILGYIGIHPGFDIGMWDLNKEGFFSNPDRYPREYRATVRYTDYLTSELRDQIWKINPRTVEPRGGSIAYDVEGTLSGNWFIPGTKALTEWSKQLVIARHERYADRITIADASPLLDGDGAMNIGRASYIWWIKGNSPLPETVIPASGKIKYAVADWWKFRHQEGNPDGTLLIMMENPRQIRYQYFAGKMPEEVTDFTSEARIYVR